MKTRILGTTGTAVSRLALGCGSFGGIGSMRHLKGRGLDHDASLATMDEAVALGIDLFDTAHGYADGTSERWIGEWLRGQTAGTRSTLRLATKVGLIDGGPAGGGRVDLSPDTIVAQLAESLERLGVSRVDFCLSHAPDPGTPIEQTLEGFADVIARGWVSHVGACNLSAGQLTAALEASTRLGLPCYEWLQNEYNLLHRGDEGEVLALCAGHGLGYTPFSPLAGGLLSGKYRQNEAPPPDSRLALRPEGRQLSGPFFEGMNRLEAEAKRRGCDPGALALAWVVEHPQVTAAIYGPSRQPEHLRLARRAAAIEIDEPARAEMCRWFTAGS